MNKLNELQNKFIDGVYGLETRAALGLIKESQIKKQHLLGVYQNNLQQNLLNALRLTFERVVAFLGEKKFNEIGKEYINFARSKSGNLDEYGDEFSAFLRKKRKIFLADLAQLDWLRQSSYLAKNDQEINLQKLQNLEGEKFFDLRFKLSASCFFVESEFNLLAKKSPEKKRKNRCFFLIHRILNEVVVQKISKKEFVFLQNLKNGETLFQACQKSKCDGEALQKFISNRVLVEFH